MSGRSVASASGRRAAPGRAGARVQLTPTATSPATPSATATASAIGSPAAVWPPSRHWYDSQAVAPSSSTQAAPAPPPRAPSGWSRARAGPRPASSSASIRGAWRSRRAVVARVVVAAVLGAVGEHRPVRPDRSGDEQARRIDAGLGRVPRRGPAGRRSTLVAMAVERRRPIQPGRREARDRSPGSWPSWRPGRRPGSTRGGRPRWPSGSVNSSRADHSRSDRSWPRASSSVASPPSRTTVTSAAPVAARARPS